MRTYKIIKWNDGSASIGVYCLGVRIGWLSSSGFVWWGEENRLLYSTWKDLEAANKVLSKFTRNN